MISQEIYLEKYDWRILVFYGLKAADTEEVCNSLVQIGCTEKAVESAREHCLRGMPNTGLTYSNLAGRKSVVAISRTTLSPISANH